MTLYYIDIVNNKLSIFSLDMNDRHRFWVSNPTAKEISKKEFIRLSEIIQSNASNREQNNTAL